MSDSIKENKIGGHKHSQISAKAMTQIESESGNVMSSDRSAPLFAKTKKFVTINFNILLVGLGFISLFFPAFIPLTVLCALLSTVAFTKSMYNVLRDEINMGDEKSSPDSVSLIERLKKSLFVISMLGMMLMPVSLFFPPIAAVCYGLTLLSLTSYITLEIAPDVARVCRPVFEKIVAGGERVAKAIKGSIKTVDSFIFDTVISGIIEAKATNDIFEAVLYIPKIPKVAYHSLKTTGSKYLNTTTEWIIKRARSVFEFVRTGFGIPASIKRRSNLVSAVNTTDANESIMTQSTAKKEYDPHGNLIPQPQSQLKKMSTLKPFSSKVLMGVAALVLGFSASLTSANITKNSELNSIQTQTITNNLILNKTDDRDQNQNQEEESGNGPDSGAIKPNMRVENVSINEPDSKKKRLSKKAKLRAKAKYDKSGKSRNLSSLFSVLGLRKVSSTQAKKNTPETTTPIKKVKGPGGEQSSFFAAKHHRSESTSSSEIITKQKINKSIRIALR